ncbi:MAG: hypothetical protein IPJ65_42265 [Archangiaceae bacterium]|nr:hypothetical protein [Archangiaceae bacterium]
MKTFGNFSWLLAGAVALAGCGVGTGAEDGLDNVSGAVTQAISVPVGDPITMVAAPYVQVTAAVGDVLNLTAAGPSCGTGCSYTWYDPDQGIPRYGGAIIGYGSTLTVTEAVAGNSRINLKYCVRTSARFSRCIYTNVYVATN